MFNFCFNFTYIISLPSIFIMYNRFNRKNSYSSARRTRYDWHQNKGSLEPIRLLIILTLCGNGRINIRFLPLILHKLQYFYHQKYEKTSYYTIICFIRIIVSKVKTEIKAFLAASTTEHLTHGDQGCKQERGVPCCGVGHVW